MTDDVASYLRKMNLPVRRACFITNALGKPAGSYLINNRHYNKM